MSLAMTSRSVLFILVILLTSCASGPELEKYPRRELDRPFTLPEGVANWHTQSHVGYFQSNETNRLALGIPSRIYWEYSLSDSWGLLFSPLPMGFTHQFLFNETNRLGVIAGVGLLIGPEKYFRLLPYIGFSYRFTVNKNLAMDIQPTFNPDFPIKGSEDLLWSISTGPMFQLREDFAIKPSLLLAEIHDETRSVSRARFDDVDDAFFVMGLELSVVWSTNRQWDLRPSYAYQGIVSKSGYQGHIGSLDFVHFW